MGHARRWRQHRSGCIPRRRINGGNWGQDAHDIFHAHRNDHIGAYPEWDHKIPGQGDLDYPRIVQGLKDIGFSEAISIETFVTMDFDEACDVGYKALAPSMGKTT